MIRVAVPAGEYKGLDSMVRPHFGRCPYFVLVDFEERKVKTVRTVLNPHHNQHQPGQVPSFVYSQQIDVMLTDGMEGRALAFSQQYSIQAMTDAPGTVRHTLEQYVGYRLEESGPCRDGVERE